MIDLNANYRVVNFSTGDTKAGTKMGKLQLKNMNDESVLNCILWEEALNRIDAKIFRTGNVVYLTEARYNEKFNNCLVSELELVEEAKTGLTEQEQNEKYKQIVDTINSFEREDLKKFTLEIIEKNETQLKIAPAAKYMHHNYVGGLLQHTTECIEIAETILPKLNGMERDELLCALILHDIGKVFEYTIDIETGLIDFNEDFRKDWITHSQYGYSLAMNNGQKKIAKMIAAHHGRTEWGAIVDLGEKDLEPFYYIVHHIDDISARFGKINISQI
ncbi:MAG: HD domain-containing protein [Cyanobacteria bacterium SIG30]|nr:HD domain-containing protein [Cyanobacteria bacterium SIG30]